MITLSHNVKKSRLEVLCADINDLAHALGPGARLPTVLQLRDQFGTSIASIDNALGRLVENNVIERRHGVGIFVSKNLHQRNICLIQDPLFLTRPGSSPFWKMLLEHAEERASDHFERFTLHFSTPATGHAVRLQESLKNEILTDHVDGILAVAIDPDTMTWLRSVGVPTVAFACYGQHMVALQGDSTVKMGVRELAALGCKNIGLWLSCPPNQDHDQHIVGVFKDALQENKASFHPKNVVSSQTQCDIGLMDNVEVGYSTADRIFGKPRQTWPDGIVFIEDTMTMGAIAAMNKHGVHIGRDVQIATHANTGSPLLIGARGSIVTIEFDPKQIVDAMYTTLESVMESKTTESSTHWIEPLLITRPSKSAC